MIKRITLLALALALLLTLAACGGKPADPPAVSTPQPGQSAPAPDASKPESPAAAQKHLEGDSFWTATSWEVDGDAMDLPTSYNSVDLTFWADGTARLRDIEQGLINNEQQLRLVWEETEDGSLLLNDADTGTLCWSGKWEGDELILEYIGGLLRLRQEEMPEGGMLYSPAELRGTWLMVSGETEGYEWEAMPGTFMSMAFYHQWEGTQGSMVADSDASNWEPYLTEKFSRYETEILDQPLYSGCGNEEWSVRVGPESERDANGYPINIEYYVTLLDQDTLLCQQYWTMDGGPFVSYQTFKRILPESSHWDLTEDDLSGAWKCVSYQTAEGNRLPASPSMANFQVDFLSQDECRISWLSGDGSTWYEESGVWSMGAGGTLQMSGGGEEPVWFAGAARGHMDITMDSSSYDVELYIYDHSSNGIMRLQYAGASEDHGPGQYVDTMNDLEGNAFAAPASALLVMYGEEWLTDFAHLDIPRQDLADGPDVGEVLVTAVADGTHLWVEQDGFLVADLGVLDAGESMIIHTGIPETGGARLYFTVLGQDYFTELSRTYINPLSWWYVEVG